MSPMQVIPMGYLETLNIKHIHRPNHGVNRVLIAEILIELAIAALIVVGAGSEIDALFHMMQAGTPPLWKFS
jgi:hypothetical protein